MSDDILLRFLQNGLINVGGDDAKLKKLQDTANVLSAVLQKNPAKTTAFALTRFRPRYHRKAARSGRGHSRSSRTVADLCEHLRWHTNDCYSRRPAGGARAGSG